MTSKSEPQSALKDVAGESKKEATKTESTGSSRYLAKATKKTARVRDAKVLELGILYWCYRPKVDVHTVDVHTAHSLNDVQKTYLLMVPSQSLEDPRVGTDKTVKRLIVVPQKKLPAVKGHGRTWGFVDLATSDTASIDQVLGPKTYETMTRGERHLQEVRFVGQAVYELILHESTGTVSLAYVLEEPHEPAKIQHEFNIEHEASYVLQVKNPKSGVSPLGLKDKAELPSHLLETFKGIRVDERKWSSPNQKEILDYRHVEILFIGEADNLQDEFGEVGKALEDEEKADEPVAHHQLEQAMQSSHSQAIEPLASGKWR